MLNLVFCSLLGVSAVSAPSLEVGRQVTYRGSMVAEKGEPVVTTKDFELTIVVAEADESGVTLCWSLNEDGRGAWPWTARFGQWRLNSQLRGDRENSPTLLYQRDTGTSMVPLVAPLLTSEKTLAPGASWSVDKIQHRVAKGDKIKDRDTWKVVATTPYGHKRTQWVEKKSPLVVAMVETVFIGQGEQFEMKVELAGDKQLPAAELNPLLDAFAGLLELRDQLKVESRDHRVAWNDEQTGLLKKQLPPIIAATKGGPLEKVTRSAWSDAKEQKDRNVTIAAMRKRAVGQPFHPFDLEDLSGKHFGNADLKGRVTVFHFWQYRDKPLEEPYGQVGYVDYLSRRVDADQVQVYGVTVDPRLGDPNTRSRAIIAAKKLKSFMNLSFPVLLDEGSLIRALGDPRRGGGKLPLYVVVDQAGKVVHYHAGLYEVSRDRGLHELEDAVKANLDKAE